MWNSAHCLSILAHGTAHQFMGIRSYQHKNAGDGCTVALPSTIRAPAEQPQLIFNKLAHWKPAFGHGVEARTRIGTRSRGLNQTYGCEHSRGLGKFSLGLNVVSWGYLELSLRESRSSALRRPEIPACFRMFYLSFFLFCFKRVGFPRWPKLCAGKKTEVPVALIIMGTWGISSIFKHLRSPVSCHWTLPTCCWRSHISLLRKCLPTLALTQLFSVCRSSLLKGGNQGLSSHLPRAGFSGDSGTGKPKSSGVLT